jgi:1,4-dihydroxy-2-naphthoyl-CoA hydrolase
VAPAEEDGVRQPIPDLGYGLNGVLGIEFLDVGPERVTARLDVTSAHQQPYGLVHGGVHCAMIEAVASVGAALWAMERDMAGAVGVSNTTDFLRSVRSGALHAEATPVHQGRAQQLWQVTVTRDSDHRPVARGTVRLHNLDRAETVGGLVPDP